LRLLGLVVRVLGYTLATALVVLILVGTVLLVGALVF